MLDALDDLQKKKAQGGVSVQPANPSERKARGNATTYSDDEDTSMQDTSSHAQDVDALVADSHTPHNAKRSREHSSSGQDGTDAEADLLESLGESTATPKRPRVE